jgi:hypothetical protein
MGPNDIPILERELPVDDQPFQIVHPDGLVFPIGEAKEELEEDVRE